MKSYQFLLSLMAIAIFTACSDSTTEEFNDVNPDAVARYIETLSIVSAQDPTENTTLTVNYDTADRVTSITDGAESAIFVYNNGSLTNISGPGETLSIEQLYESPYNAFEIGEVLEYDTNGNPELIRFFEFEYDFNTNTDVQVEYTAEVTYDSNPNPYFFTLDAAGVIDVLDNVQLNLTMNATGDDIIQARLLFPVNNINGITYRDDEGELVFTINADYVYNADGYPTSATVTGVSYDDFNGQQTTDTSVYSATYTYRE